MTLLQPGFMVAGIAAAAAVLALHLIMHRLPPSVHFPTARFVPPGTARAIRRALRPDDLVLLALRAVMLLLLGAALSRPVATPERRPVAKIIAMDRSRAVASIDEARDSVESLLTPGDPLIVFDSTARVVKSPGDSLRTIGRSGARGSLSLAMVATIHASEELRDRADSIEIVIVTPATLDEVDAATHAVRAVWRGGIRIVRVAADSVAVRAGAPEHRIVAEPDDPVAAAIALWGWRGRAQPVRLVRETPAPDDSAFARGGGVLVHWPAAPATERSPSDSIGAVIADDAVVVAALSRATEPEAWKTVANASPVAWWADGRPAAIQQSVGAGCIRDVAIEVPRRGDLVLRPSFQRLLRSLTLPCDGVRDDRRVSDEVLARLVGSGTVARAEALPVEVRSSSLAPWLVVGALVLSLLEPFVRRRRSET